PDETFDDAHVVSFSCSGAGLLSSRPEPDERHTPLLLAFGHRRVGGVHGSGNAGRPGSERSPRRPGRFSDGGANGGHAAGLGSALAATRWTDPDRAPGRPLEGFGGARRTGGPEKQRDSRRWQGGVGGKPGHRRADRA